MTKKDYVLIAAALKSARDAEYLIQSQGVDTAARHICSVLADENPKFDRARFLAACGVQS